MYGLELSCQILRAGSLERKNPDPKTRNVKILEPTIYNTMPQSSCGCTQRILEGVLNLLVRTLGAVWDNILSGGSWSPCVQTQTKGLKFGSVGAQRGTPASENCLTLPDEALSLQTRTCKLLPTGTFLRTP